MTRSTLREDLLAGARPLDAVVLAAPSIALVAVFLLPEPTRRSLAFEYSAPTLTTAFTAHYVHLSAEHFLANLAGYSLLAGVGYALAVAGRHRRFFLASLATFCLGFPPVLSALNLAVPRHAVGFGFSGVNMALVGLLPLLLAVYAREHFSASAPTRALPAVFFVLVGWIGFLALPISLTGFGVAGLSVAAAGLLLGATYALTSAGGGPCLRQWSREILDRAGHGDLFAVGVVLLVAYPVIGFPAEPTVDGSVVNLYVHLLGFCLAFIGPYVVLVAGVFDE